MVSKTHETLYNWMDFWREMYLRPNVAPSTYANSHYNLQILKNNFADRNLEALTLTMLQRLLNDLRDKGYAKDTIKKITSYLKRALDKAVMHNALLINPAAGIVIPKKAGKKKVKPLTQDQQKVLCIFSKDVIYGEYMEFLLLTGLRVGEFCKANWTDYNQKDKLLFIADSKTEAGVRIVPLIARAQEILEAQPRSNKDNFIFHNLHGKPITYSSMKKCYEKLREKTGFAKFTNHVCRHSFATRLIERGASPKGVAALLGHASVEFCLNVYTDIERAMAVQDIFLLENKEQENTNVIDLVTTLNQLKAQNNGSLPEGIKQILLAL